MQEHKLRKRKFKALHEGNNELLASTCIDLAEFYMKNGSFNEAIEEYTAVADAYTKMGRQLDYARANRGIGEAYIHLGDYQQALSFHCIHLRVAKEQNDKLEEQRALAMLGHTYLTTYFENIDNPDLKSLNSAYKYFMKSLCVCESLTGISKTEHKDMMARLLANLGAVEESRGNYERGIELLEKSINICKNHDLFDQLEHGYTSLAGLYMKIEEFDKAINQYNLAFETAERLDNKQLLKCMSLLRKADILIKLSDYRAAKNVLLKAYKLKHPQATEEETIEHKLKVGKYLPPELDKAMRTNTSLPFASS